MKSREKDFNLSNLGSVKLNEYNALFDPNTRHFFESKNVQLHLYKSGQIDRHGRVIDLNKNKTKLNVLEREFLEAERIEKQRLKDEQEIRYRIQRKKLQDFEMTRKKEMIEKVKADREISKEIIGILRSTSSLSLSTPGVRSVNSVSNYSVGTKTKSKKSATMNSNVVGNDSFITQNSLNSSQDYSI